MSEVELRAARVTDEPFLWRMLVEAASWRPDGRRLSVDDAIADPELARYVGGWGREGDLGLVAEVDEVPVGAAWWRFFGEPDRGYGFIGSGIPELSIGVVEPMRGRGIGSVLLRGLIEQAHQQRLAALSLSVERDNPAVRLYERLGFIRAAQVENAWTMRRELPQPAT